jgi:hypothetical protein
MRTAQYSAFSWWESLHRTVTQSQVKQDRSSALRICVYLCTSVVFFCINTAERRRLWGGFEVALGEPWGSLGVALGSHWGGFGVALGSQSVAYQHALRWLWGRIGVASSGFAQLPFRFQLSAFQLLPECGFGVALMSHWVALPGFSRFEVQGSGFKVRVPSDTRAFHSFAACSLGVH